MKTFLLCGWVIVLTVVLAACSEPYKKTLGNDYYIMGNKDDSASMKLVHGVNDGYEDVVLGEIVDYDANDGFILIHRKVTERARALFEDHPLWQKQARMTDQYWIIEKKFDGVNGPLTYEEYLAKRKQLEVSDGIKIRQ
jgi:hypothetical protein